MGRKLENGEDFTDTFGLRTRRIPVDLSPGTPVKVRWYLLDVQAGDYLKVRGELDVTNDAGRYTTKKKRYTVGIGGLLRYYNASAPTTPIDLRAQSWRNIGRARGMNCTVDMHHLALDVFGEVTIPADWPPGNKACIVLLADAHSDAWNSNSPTGGDWVDIEDHGGLNVTRYRDSPPPVDDPRWTDLGDLQRRVTALEATAGPRL